MVRVEAMPSGEPSEVVLAIAESGLTSHPTRGENEGRALPHTAVVRSLRVLGEARSGAELAAKLLLSPNWNRAALKVVVFVQEMKTRHIVGAAQMQVPLSPDGVKGASDARR